jgi:transposase
LPPQILEQRLEDILIQELHRIDKPAGGAASQGYQEVRVKAMKSSWKVRAWVISVSTCYVGIDVSKASLDVCVLRAGSVRKDRRFSNSALGFSELSKWCSEFAPLTECHFCLESTGTYGLGIASTLSDAGYFVSVENPRFIKHFAIGERMQNKTDKSDAFAIAMYCAKNSPPRWSLGDPALRELDLLLKRISDLGQVVRMESNRLECQYLPQSVRDSICRSVKAMESEIEAVIQEIESKLALLPQIQAMARALFREPGVGELSALRVLAHMGWNPLNFADAQQCAAAAGFNPVRRESGNMIGLTRISKHGDPAFRSEIYMTALAATSFNPRVKAFYEKLLAKGMTKKAALIACARKLLMLLYGILKAHILGKEPVYSSVKARYTNLRGKQRTLKICGTSLTGT